MSISRFTSVWTETACLLIVTRPWNSARKYNARCSVVAIRTATVGIFVLARQTYRAPPSLPFAPRRVSIVNGRENRHDGHRKNRRRIMGGTSWYTNSFLVPVRQNRIPLPPHTKATEKMMRCLALRTLHHPRRYAGASASMFPGARFAHKTQR